RLGGPYEAPGAAIRLGGSLVLGWSDGQVTRSRLDRTTIESPTDALAGWRESVSAERRRPAFALPAPVPAVETFDVALANAVGREPALLLRMLADVQASTTAERARRLDAT